MKVEFRQGVPRGCIEWLWNNVGPGNVEPRGDPGIDWGDAWKYERVTKPINPQAFGDDPFEYVPTITVKDPKQAVIFALKWA